MKRVLPDIINNDQIGFLKGRSIAENILLIDGIINFAAENTKPGLLLLIDFEKAFDALEWNFIEKFLRHFNFGPSLIIWFRLFYTGDITSAIRNNRWISPSFQLNISRGVRQSCPLSPYLFIIAAEVSANFIRAEKNIKGFVIYDEEHKIGQFADDTTLLLDVSEESFQNSLKLFDLFGSSSGLKVPRLQRSLTAKEK